MSAYSMLLLAVLAAGTSGFPQEERAPTVTSTKTVIATTTSTSTVSTATVCASFVNATAACRRRRNHWIDLPIVLALDDDSDDFLETHLNPSAVLRVQATMAPKQAVPDDLVVSDSAVASSLDDHRPLPEIRVASSIYFSQLVDLINSAFHIASTVFNTVTSTTTKVVTATSTTSTKTLFISGCSPPLPYQTC